MLSMNGRDETEDGKVYYENGGDDALPDYPAVAREILVFGQIQTTLQAAQFAQRDHLRARAFLSRH